MKRCPECRRDYYDDTLLYCLDDGNALLEGPSSADEQATAILHSTAAGGEAPTRAQIHLTDQTAILPANTGEIVPKPRGFDKRLLAIPFLLAIIALGGFFGYRYFNSASTEQINSIAVLPFENRSANADTDYLSDGLADSLIYRLSQLPNLKVSPTSSVMRYKGKETDVAQIAKELEVDAVMSGRLVQRGDDLSISVQLIDSRTKKLIWAEQYDRKMADLLATQREIATTITQKLQLKLASTETKGITKKYTDSNEAYQLYLKGRFYWGKRDEENIKKAIEQFKAAADKDPNYALAVVGLADCYAVLPFYSNAAWNETMLLAKTYATRALEIDDSLGEAHTSLGYINLNLIKWSEAEKELKRGIELNPNYATAHKFYGNYFEDSGRIDEALAKFKKAQELEPLSLILSLNLAEVYLVKGDAKAAFDECQRAIDLAPDWYVIRYQLANVYLKQGRNAEALAEAEKAVELSKRQRTALSTLGYVYAQTGKRSEAEAILAELKEKYVKGQASGIDLAAVCVGLNDKDQAFVWLEKDFQYRDFRMTAWLNIVPFNSLRDDPRYKDLLKRLNLPE